MNTPASDGFRMPAEWTPHERTWMAWPGPNPTFADPGDLAAARTAWAEVARAVRRFEPVTVVCGPGQSAQARRLLGPGIDTVERELDDAWMRDVGPTFLTDGAGRLAAVDWTFNGWGAQEWARWEHDAKIAAHVADLAGARTYATDLVNEGGGIHVDGEGTVLLTETVQLGPERNPGRTRAEVEAEIHAHLGTSKAIWLPRGLTADYPPYGFGTLGHVDIVAAFARPGVVVAHHQPDPAHPDHEVTREAIGLLRGRRTREDVAWRSSRCPPRPYWRRTATGPTTPTSTTTCATAAWCSAASTTPATRSPPASSAASSPTARSPGSTPGRSSRAAAASTASPSSSREPRSGRTYG